MKRPEYLYSEWTDQRAEALAKMERAAPELAEALHSLIIAVVQDNEVPRNSRAYNATDKAKAALLKAGWEE